MGIFVIFMILTNIYKNVNINTNQFNKKLKMKPHEKVFNFNYSHLFNVWLRQ